ncbi:MAG TPA: class I SAM-dependent methyltransferase [Bacteroidota bacterium]|nr:class I SAM-dependent methyltransferase [Bacteroidota bacterium]
MKYDPIKKVLGDVVRENTLLRKLFYKILGLMFLREWHVKRELRQILGADSTPKKIYDAGCGFGQYSYYCATHFPGVSIYAVDVKSEQIEDCSRFFRSAGISNAEFAVEDLTQIHHQNKFDFAISVDVMEHIPDDVGVFRNLYDSLRSGGRLLVNTPSDLGGSDAHGPEDESFIEEHARNGYGVEEIRTKLTSVGFTVEKIGFAYGPWGSIAWRLGIKYPMLLLNASKVFFILLPFYYILTLPFTLLLMYLDYAGTNKTGTGLVVVATKK